MILLRFILTWLFYVHEQLLALNTQCWHDWAPTGTPWPGCGLGPAALSLVLGCSCRQGHMPEGELATLLPIPPGALLNPYLLFLRFSFSSRVLPRLPFLVTSHARRLLLSLTLVSHFPPVWPLFFICIFLLPYSVELFSLHYQFSWFKKLHLPSHLLPFCSLIPWKIAF